MAYYAILLSSHKIFHPEDILTNSGQMELIEISLFQ